MLIDFYAFIQWEIEGFLIGEKQNQKNINKQIPYI